MVFSLRLLDLLMKAFWIFIIGRWFFNWTGMSATLNELFITSQASNSS